MNNANKFVVFNIKIKKTISQELFFAGSSYRTPNINYLVYKLIVKNNLYGYFILMHSGDDFELIRLTVKKCYHHQGYGQQMLKYILTHFSYQQIFLEVNEHNLVAQQLYLKHGFKIIRTIAQYYGSENGYLMVYHH